jgi:UDP-N-acetylmuramate--alanine ligase
LAEINDYKNEKVFFSGIGGVSMSSLALILKNNGFSVYGSDRESSAVTDKLTANGITVFLTQAAENVSGAGLIVRTAAVSDDNPEIVRARELNIPVMERSVLLGQIMKSYAERVNIAGTHGKTTTTSMAALILMYAGLKPTVTVGGEFDKIGGNLLIGENDWFVCEACEYVESFLDFFPTASIILNIEEDHLDYYRDIGHIKSAFRKFAEKTEKLIVANGDDANVTDVLKDNEKTVFFGLKNTHGIKYTAKNIIYSKSTTEYDLYCDSVFLAKITLKAAGGHNVSNSLGAATLALELGIDISYIKAGLFDFTGAKRRMEYIGETAENIQVYDDYAHHPTEIKTTVAALKQKKPKRVVMLFQPHTYTRTKAFKNEFKEALSLADKVYVADIYAAREKDPGDIHARDLTDGLPNAEYIGELSAAAEKIAKELKAGDIFVTVGAGDVYKAGQMPVCRKD